VFALGDRCSHAEASLADGLVSAGTVECPRHGAVFDLRSGAALTMPATRPVPAYPVEVEGDEVYVDVPAEGESR
jgi:3-phenylpropionate/trans-cinnamate dioxygenase ferredoxin subunit